jgi:uncharacterized protein (TIGR00661 family)
MNQHNIEKIPGKSCLPARQARILVAPLDWGLGHATRCIPIIHELLKQNCDVWLAGEDAQEDLLRQEFPSLPFLELPGYRIKYAKTKRGLIWKMLKQGPKMKRAIQYEHKWLRRMVSEYKIDAVISDNRYGLYHSTIPCIFITHQLQIKSAAGKWTEKILQNRNYDYINRFTACWVPDIENENNLAGTLAHPGKKPLVPLHYIGWLSRLKREMTEPIKDHLLIILSGPEPQRSLLEEKIINEISHYNGTATVVRGLPGSASLIPSTNMLRFYNHLPAEEMNSEMQQASYVISRSGYSTVMDIVTLQKKSILIPTPGQTEQEYLGKHLMEKHIAVTVLQDDFSLNNALTQARTFDFHFPEMKHESLLENIIEEFLASIPSKQEKG